MGLDRLEFDRLEELCVMKHVISMITNRQLIYFSRTNHFQGTSTTENRLSDCHKLISTFMRSFVSCLKPKIMFFRNYKKFDETKFLSDLKNTTFSFTPANLMKTIYFSRIHFSKLSRYMFL